MARNRKTTTKTEGLPTNGSWTLPDDEKWRLITEAGVLDQVPVSEQRHEEATPLGEEIFSVSLLIIPMSFLLLMMEILIHYQYGKQPTLQALVDRMAPGVPILSIFIFYSTIIFRSLCPHLILDLYALFVTAARYKHHRRMQFFLFVLSVLVGSRMIYVLDRSSWLVTMRQCPPLATIWVYTILQLDLGPAVLNLVTVASFVWWKGLKIFG